MKTIYYFTRLIVVSLLFINATIAAPGSFTRVDPTKNRTSFKPVKGHPLGVVTHDLPKQRELLFNEQEGHFGHKLGRDQFGNLGGFITSYGDTVAVAAPKSHLFGEGLNRGAGAVYIFKGSAKENFKMVQVLGEGMGLNFGNFAYLAGPKTLVVTQGTQGRGSGFSNRSYRYVPVHIFRDHGSGFVHDRKFLIDDKNTWRVGSATHHGDYLALFSPSFDGGTRLSIGRGYVFNMKTGDLVQKIDPPFKALYHIQNSLEVDIITGGMKILDGYRSTEILFGSTLLPIGSDLYVGCPLYNLPRQEHGRGGLAKYSWVDGKLELQASWAAPLGEDFKASQVMSYKDGTLWSFSSNGTVYGLRQSGRGFEIKHQFKNTKLSVMGPRSGVCAQTLFYIDTPHYYTVEFSHDNVSFKEEGRWPRSKLHSPSGVSGFQHPTDFGTVVLRESRLRGIGELIFIDLRAP